VGLFGLQAMAHSANATPAAVLEVMVRMPQETVTRAKPDALGCPHQHGLAFMQTVNTRRVAQPGGPMRPVSIVERFLPAIALLALVVACDKHASGTPTSPSTPTTGLPTVSSLEINGPASMAPGQSAQFTAIAHLSNSVSTEPTTVRWISSPSDFLRVDQSGYATAGPINGGAAVTADITVAGTSGGVLRASKSVIVLPDGTFRMVGLVTDAEFSSAPVAGALVEVTPGSLSATTDSDGFYRIYGVPPNAEVRVTANGYQPLVQALGLTSHARQDFGLTLSGARLNLSGTYTLAIDVDDGCPGSTPLAPDLQHRRYDAVLTQSGLTLDVMLTEPRFRLTGGRGNRFRGRVDGSGASFSLGYYDPGDWGLDPTYPDVAERLPNGTFLIVSGTAVTTGSAAGLSGTLDLGGLSNFDSRYPEGAFELGSCGGKHRFTLTPR